MQQWSVTSQLGISNCSINNAVRVVTTLIPIPDPRVAVMVHFVAWLGLVGKQCYLECSIWFCKACHMYLEKGFKAETSIINNFCTTPVGFISWKTKFSSFTCCEHPSFKVTKFIQPFVFTNKQKVMYVLRHIWHFDNGPRRHLLRQKYLSLAQSEWGMVNSSLGGGGHGLVILLTRVINIRQSPTLHGQVHHSCNNTCIRYVAVLHVILYMYVIQI